MLRSVLTHSGWLFVTIATYLAGTHFARQSLSDEAVDLTRTKSRDRPSAIGSNQPGAPSKAPLIFSDEIASLSDQHEPIGTEGLNALVLAAIKSSSPIERRKAFDRILNAIRSESFTAELAVAIRKEMFVNGASGEMWQLFDYAWGRNHPDAAIAYIDQIPERYKDRYTGSMLPGLASNYPERAIGLVAAMEVKLRRQMTDRLLEGLVDFDPAFATDYVIGLHRDGDSNARGYMNRLAREMLQDGGFESGLAWAETLPAGPLQGAALVPVANEFAKRDPNGAAQWAEGYIGQRDASRIFGEVVREWGDWQAASAWVGSLEEGQGQRDALSAVYGFRGATEPHDAVRDIIGMQQSPDRDFAINGFISGLAHRDGEAAVLWAAEIETPGMREAAMIRAGRQFFRQDQQAASDWFSNSGLPDNRWSQIADGGR